MMNNPFQNFTRNGVISLSVLKKKNYPLFRYYMSNRNVLKRRFKDEGIEILNDITTKNTYTNIKLFLLYHYGDVVNMNVLREKDRTVYNYISKLGNPNEVIEKMGFKVEYSKFKRSMDYLMAELNRIADDDGYIYKINDAALYSKLQNRARNNELSVKEYMTTLGFSYGLNTKRLISLREQGYSMSKIGELLGISHTTVSRELRKVGEPKQED